MMECNVKCVIGETEQGTVGETQKIVGSVRRVEETGTIPELVTDSNYKRNWPTLKIFMGLIWKSILLTKQGKVMLSLR